jgi:hypothetical protein
MSGAQDMSRRAFPEALRRLVAPWWEQRAVKLGEAMKRALESGGTTVVIDGKRVHVERLAEMAEEALEMADRFSEPAR